MWKISVVAVGLLFCAAMVGESSSAWAARGFARGGGGIARAGGGVRSFGGARSFHFSGARVGGFRGFSRRASFGHVFRGARFAHTARFSRLVSSHHVAA